MTSCTVVRSFSWSSGISTPNLSCAATAISTIDSESMSRSSTKLLAGVTSSAGTPAISSTISPIPARISCSFMPLAPCLECSYWSAAPRCPRRPRHGRLGWARLGYRDHLRCVAHPRAEPEQQGGRPRFELAAPNHPRQGQRDRGRRRVTRVHDVIGYALAGHAEPARDGLDDPQVRLVRDERGQLAHR